MSKSRDERDGGAGSEGAAQVLAATREARVYAHRRRLGLPGTEPYEVRRPLWRGYVALLLGLASLFLSGAGQVQVSAGLALAALVVGLPRAWLWGHDRLSAFSWSLAVTMLIAGEIFWLAGGTAARQSPSKGLPGAAVALIGLCSLVALAGFLRRWGTKGNVYYADRQVRRGDPAATQAVVEGAEREGWRPPEPPGRDN